MHLLQRSTGFLRWYWHIVVVLLRRRCWATLTTVVLTVISIITNLLAFMLPLKVIILAGSDGVPRYFRFFIDPADKWPWIIGLTIGAIVCFIVSIICDMIIKRVSSRAGGDILQQANELAVVADQETVVGGHYGRLCQVQASLWFALIAAVALAFIHPIVLYTLLILAGSQYLLAMWAVAGRDDCTPGRFKATVQEKPKVFVGMLSKINFIIIFLVILAPYLVGQGGNFLLSLIAFILVRKLLGIIASGITNCVALEKSRLSINAMLFREHQMVQKEGKGKALVRDIFAKPRRTQMLAEVLAESDLGSKKTHQTQDAPAVLWQDSSIRGVSTMLVELPASLRGSSAHAYLQLQAYPRKQGHFLDNEERLFTMVSRQRLWAPQVVAAFPQGDFRCQLVAFGSGEVLGSAEWKEWEPKIYAQLWSYAPSPELCQAFQSSHASLPQRLDSAMIERATVAVDTPEEEAQYADFTAKHQQLCDDLTVFPLVVHNPALIAKNVVWHGDQEVAIVSWGKWSLEPMGVVLPSADDDATLQGILDALAEQRSDFPQDFSPRHLRLAETAWQLEMHLNKGMYKAALASMADITNWYAS